MMSLFMLQRPTLEGVVDWIDLETISLLFGMVRTRDNYYKYSAITISLASSLVLLIRWLW